MEWSVIYNLIAPELFAVVTACWAVGYMLKQTPHVPDWSIVYIVTAVAIGFAIAIKGWNAEAIVQGILSGAFAVYGHQIVKQAREGVRKQE